MNAKTSKELRRIMRSIPEELKDNLLIKVNDAPVLNELYERAKADKEADPEAIRKLEMIKKSGFMDRQVEQVDSNVSKKIDKFLDEQIKRSIKLGRLPKPEDDEDFKKYIRKTNEKDIRKNLPLANEAGAGEQNQEGNSPK